MEVEADVFEHGVKKLSIGSAKRVIGVISNLYDAQQDRGRARPCRKQKGQRRPRGRGDNENNRC